MNNFEFTLKEENKPAVAYSEIKAHLLDLEAKIDKNGQPYYRISLAEIPSRYYYAFSYNLSAATLKSLTTPLNWINRLVAITYQELPNQNNLGSFYKVKGIELV